MAAFHVVAARCGGNAFRGSLGPTQCGGEPTFAGLWLAAHGRTVWLGFACAGHADQLIAPRPCYLGTGTSSTPAGPSAAPNSPGSDGHGSKKARSPVAPRQSGLVERAKAWAERRQR
jgi:hypothetical protein